MEDFIDGQLTPLDVEINAIMKVAKELGLQPTKYEEIFIRQRARELLSLADERKSSAREKLIKTIVKTRPTINKNVW